jgi:predicted RNA binding protein YcfA (HicA-like mRNA interferase family)
LPLSKLTPVSRIELIKRLNNLGFEGPIPGRKHRHMVKGDLLLMLPNPHHREKIGVNLLLEILRKAKISRDEWLSSG